MQLAHQGEEEEVHEEGTIGIQPISYQPEEVPGATSSDAQTGGAILVSAVIVALIVITFVKLLKR